MTAPAPQTKLDDEGGRDARLDNPLPSSQPCHLFNHHLHSRQSSPSSQPSLPPMRHHQPAFITASSLPSIEPTHSYVVGHMHIHLHSHRLYPAVSHQADRPVNPVHCHLSNPLNSRQLGIRRSHPLCILSLKIGGGEEKKRSKQTWV